MKRVRATLAAGLAAAATVVAASPASAQTAPSCIPGTNAKDKINFQLYSFLISVFGAIDFGEARQRNGRPLAGARLFALAALRSGRLYYLPAMVSALLQRAGSWQPRRARAGAPGVARCSSAERRQHCIARLKRHHCGTPRSHR